MTRKRKGNVYETGSDILSHKVSISFVSGDKTVQIHAGSYATALEARAAAKAVKTMRRALRNLGYIPHQRPGRPRTVSP